MSAEAYRSPVFNSVFILRSIRRTRGCCASSRPSKGSSQMITVGFCAKIRRMCTRCLCSSESSEHCRARTAAASKATASLLSVPLPRCPSVRKPTASSMAETIARFSSLVFFGLLGRTPPTMSSIVARGGNTSLSDACDVMKATLVLLAAVWSWSEMPIARTMTRTRDRTAREVHRINKFRLEDQIPTANATSNATSPANDLPLRRMSRSTSYTWTLPARGLVRRASMRAKVVLPTLAMPSTPRHQFSRISTLTSDSASPLGE
mmetsp:Transcript_8680/g.19000  ORF Transcript_8680/g.19000 Transcript_8680/m.19000 type:complete len:263 (-) Transcript_8680:275-1063(-)